MAESAVIFLLKQLSIWLKEEQKLLGGLSGEVQLIRGELEQRKVFLRAADAREENDPQAKEWVRQIREIAYDIQDVLESYMLKFDSHHSHGVRGHMRNIYARFNLKGKHQIASEIKALRSRAENASKTFKDLREMIPTGTSYGARTKSTWHDGRSDALRLEKADVVGIERPKKQLLEWISTTNYTLKVVSVVGMAGLGKTTLVKQLYNDLSVKENIDYHAWINVSETYTVENLLQRLIKQLHKEVKQASPPGLETMDADDMREFIYNFLKDKNYLIVLDDIWIANAWDALRYAFPRSTTHGHGCIIITTRSRNVGNAACCENGGYVYALQPLSPEKAEELFQKKAFPGKQSCPLHLKEISRNILMRCGGLPLAIVLMGSVLATKRNEIEEWRKFSHNMGSELVRDNLKRMWELLSLSYYDLPYYLQSCLLYLSVFPEDHLLEKGTITRLWIAEGFVEAKQSNDNIEEIAEEYLNELSNRSLIQVANKKHDGRPRNFCIHDFVREYIISKAREHNLLAAKSERGIPWDDKIRCLALDDRFRSSAEQINNYKCLRTLVFFGSFDLEWGSILCKILQGGCRMLHELDLRGVSLDEIPDEVFKLYGLKYLSLKDTNVSLIPKSIGNLENLETLNLKGSKVNELPIQILKLKKLRYLSAYRYEINSPYVGFDYTKSFKSPYEIGRLFNLRKICYIDASVNIAGTTIVSEIGKLRELRRLGIMKLREKDGKELCSSLQNLTYLRSLYIGSLEEGEKIDLQYLKPASLQHLQLIELRGCLEKVPQWVSSLKALKTLYLSWSKMVVNPLECLQDLPSLQILGMDGAYEGQGLRFISGGFTSLTQLWLRRLDQLKWVRVEKGSMVNLKLLSIRNCKAMRLLPMGIEHLTHLDCVEFADMAEVFVEKVIKEKERNGDQWKLAHVPKTVVANWVDGKWSFRRP